MGCLNRNTNPVVIPDGSVQSDHVQSITFRKTATNRVILEDESNIGDARPQLTGRATRFKGSPSETMVITGPHTEFDRARGFTWTAWVYAYSLAGSQGLFSRGGGTNRTPWIYLNADGTVFFQIETYPAFALDVNCASNKDITTHKWYHIACTWDGYQARIYIDGVFDDENNSSNGGEMSTATGSVLLGKITGRHNGLMYDMRCWYRGLTDREIKYVFTFGKHGKDPGLDKMFGWWKLDGDSDDTYSAYDCSGNGHHASWESTAPTTPTEENGTMPHVYHNEVGYTLSNGIYIPRDESNTEFDIQGNDLQYKGKVPREALLLQSNCVEHDNSKGDSYVDTDVDSTESKFTIASWVKGTTGDQWFFEQDVDDFKIAWASGGNIEVYDGTARTIGPTPTDTGWHHLALVFNETTINCYLDNQPYGNQMAFAELTLDSSSGNQRIGRGSSLKMADFNVYDEPLSSGQITYLYTDGLSGTSPSKDQQGRQTQLLASYPFAEGSGMVAYDVGPCGNHGLYESVILNSQDSDIYHYNINYGFERYRPTGSGGGFASEDDIKVPLRKDGIRLFPDLSGYQRDSVHYANKWHNGAETLIDFRGGYTGTPYSKLVESGWHPSGRREALPMLHFESGIDRPKHAPQLYKTTASTNENFEYYKNFYSEYSEPVAEISEIVTWADFSIPDRLYQDTGMLIPAESGDIVSLCIDKARFNQDLHYTQSSTGLAPTWESNVWRGLGALKFNATTNMNLELPDLSTRFDAASNVTQAFEVIAVARLPLLGVVQQVCDGESVGDRGTIFRQAAGNLGINSSTTLNSTITGDPEKFFIIHAKFHGADSYIRIDGYHDVDGSAGSDRLLGVVLGTRYDGANPASGEIIHYMAIDAQLSAVQTAVVEGYLKQQTNIVGYSDHKTQLGLRGQGQMAFCPNDRMIWSVGGIGSDAIQWTNVDNWVCGYADDSVLDRDYAPMVWHPDDEVFYIYGGRISGSTYTSGTYNFYPNGELLRDTGLNMPDQRWNQSAIYSSLDNNIYLFGGVDGASTYESGVWVHNTTSGTLTDTTAAFPSGIAGMASAYCDSDDKIYLFGGSDGTAKDHIFVYDPSTPATAPSALPTSLPTGINYGGACYYPSGDCIYLFGGSNSSTYYDTVIKYDVATTGVSTLSETLPRTTDQLHPFYDSVTDRVYAGPALHSSQATDSDATDKRVILEFNPNTETFAAEPDLDIPT